MKSPTLLVEKVRKLPTASKPSVSCLKLNLGGPPVLHNLIQISLVLQGIVEAQRLVLVVLVQTPIITAKNSTFKLIAHGKKKNKIDFSKTDQQEER